MTPVPGVEPRGEHPEQETAKSTFHMLPTDDVVRFNDL